MQLVQENSSFISLKKPNISMSLESSTHYAEVGQKRSSNASLLLMNPVASGDNMATDLNSAQKCKEELPLLVPCCEGKELQISEDIVRSGLSAISVKHESVYQCLSTSCASGRTLVPHSVVKHRNSFRCLHRPDLKRVPYLRRLTPDELEMIFRGFADIPHRLTTKSENLNVKTSPETSIGSKELGNTTALGQSDGIQLHPIPEIKSGVEDVPAGMRLHGTRARLYTSVLAGTKTGDQLDNTTSEDEDMKIPDDAVPEDEIQLSEELQIILPPRCDEVFADSSQASSTIN